MWKRSMFIMFLLLLGLLLIGCQSSKSSSDEKIVIEFWHSLSGENGDNFKKIIDTFNEQSDTIEVIEIYQGSYTDLITKVRAVGDSDQAPALIQASGTNRLYMAQSDFVIPMQDFIDAEDFDISQFEENAMN